MTKIPNNAFVMIIGAMKCGTSSLDSFLIEHPSICPCIRKEPEFFSENQGHGYNAGKYEDLWDFDIHSHSHALEASTGYTKYPAEARVPEKIYKYGIEPKFIYVVRHPFERIISHYNYMKNAPGFDRDISIAADHFINISSYFLQLEQYRKYFPKKNFLIVDFDELRNSPETTFIKIIEFLDISQNYSPISFGVYNKTISLSKAELFFRRNSNLNKITNLLPNQVKKIGEKIIKKISKPEEKRQFSDQEKGVVFNLLKNDMRRFHEEYGFDTQKWGFNI